ncbi:MAG: hypothetical protein R8G01_18500 [Ilumatobacteraceae bacterium]|nr:hypothetical protein [Ilumatobacteraceae bacterium]
MGFRTIRRIERQRASDLVGSGDDARTQFALHHAGNGPGDHPDVDVDVDADLDRSATGP